MSASRLLLVLAVVAAILSTGLVPALGQAVSSVPPVLPDGETAVVRVYYPDDASRIDLFLAFEPQVLETDYRAGYHVMQVTQAEIDRLAALGLRVQLDTAYSAPPIIDPLPEGIESIPGYACYRTVEETFASAQALVTSHPDLATWIDVGDSWEKSAGLGGYDMMVLRLTNSAITGDKPDLFVTGAIHAREYVAAETATRFGEYLVNNYGTDADVTWILDHHEIHLMLQTNPDGRKQAEAGLSWRKNTNQTYCGPTSTSRGADLNRNCTFKWGCCGGSSTNPCDVTYRGASAGSEPEIQAFQDYMASIFPDQRGPLDTDAAPTDTTGIYIDLHSYGQLVIWPWGWTSSPAPNSTQLQTLGRKLAYFNSHTPKQEYSLYPTDGITDGHAYGVFGVAAYCFEMGTAFFQSCSTFESTIYPTNLQALLYAAKVVRTPYMTPLGPDALSPAVSNGTVPEGTPVTLSATINDTRYRQTNGSEPTQNIAGAEYYVDSPPWSGGLPTAMAAADGDFSSTAEAVTAVLDTTGWSTGSHILLVRGQDANGNWGAFSAVFLTISGPLSEPPVADPQSLSTTEDTSLSITLTGSDPENGPLTFLVQSGPSHGALSGSGAERTYTPDADYHGGDSFTFVANDGQQNSEPAAVDITVTSVNDAPVASPQSVTTLTNTAVPILLSGTDMDGDALNYSVLTQPANGTLSGTAPGLTYAPGEGYTGADGFAFQVFDGQAYSAPAAVSIAVNPAGPLLYLGSSSSGTAGGIAFADEDILVKNQSTGAWALYIDGSDVGLTNTDVNAFELQADGSLLMSFDTAFTLTGFGAVDDSDILRFVPTSTGATTAGTWQWHFDGSDVGLSTNDEDVDALAVLPDGRLLVSTLGNVSVTGASGADEDLLAFSPSQLGATTSGTWTLYFDGSDVGLTTTNEDVNGAWVDAEGKIYLTTLGSFSVPGASGDGSDVFVCTPGSLGNTTTCAWAVYWDGSANGFSGEDTDAFGIVQ